ncbi:MAG TPA: outer membrane beta-barrel protein [Bacteroidales bacterium]|nr:outer membrane beta-barrel protein [Bacteroidales bacterium]
MRTVKVIILMMLSVAAYAQNYSLHGEILDEKATPMTSSTVVLLHPDDSTLQYFGISNQGGYFEVKNIRAGNYLLQVAFIGYETIFKNISIPFDDGGNLGSVIMIPKPVSLDEVTVTSERIPLQIKKDTLVYNAKAFKIKTDAVVEDLLKKLPGIEVDRAGNIKALGENVNNVLVDGKEFFGNDPKVATKNLPADAVDQVELFDKKTEEEDFTGIDDGLRNQTLNLVLDEEKKNGVFGELMAGGGTGSHYQGSGKVYRFSEKSQVAALGMINNVNKFGFSISDYLSFTGGIVKIAHGDGGLMIGGGGFPINFGEIVPGYASSGAVGFNYSYSRSKNQRFFISYLGNGSKRDLTENTVTTNFRADDAFLQTELTKQVQRDTSHNLNFGIRYLWNETNNLIVNGGISYNAGYIPLTSDVNSYLNDMLVNSMNRTSYDLSDRISGNTSGSYLKRINEGKTILKIFADANYSSSSSETDFETSTSYYNPDNTVITSQFQDNYIKNLSYSGGISFTQRLFGRIYMDLLVKAGDSNETLERRQGDSNGTDQLIDTLSPDLKKRNFWITPGLSIRRNSKKTQLTLGMDYNTGRYTTLLWGSDENEAGYSMIQPRFTWEYSYRTGRRLMLNYSTRVNTPSANQLLPVVNNFNSLSLYYGNIDLKPEFTHSISASWWIFDQFSFTTLLTSLRMRYTKDKINYSRTITDQLSQVVSLVNVESDMTVSGNIDFSTPIRPLGIQTNLNIEESINKGINLVDGLENEITNISHRLSLTFENRKKEKWDILTGAGLTVTDASYSIQESLNNIYTDLSWFGEIRFAPNDKFDINLTADITNYTARSFEKAQVIPLIGAEISYFFLQNNRAAFTISGFDLLNRNTGIDRVSELNYLMERTSNIIGRYVMFSFKYRLNKLSKGGDAINIKVNNRRR